MNDISSRITYKNKENRPLIPLTISAQEGLISQYDYFDKQIASINLSTYYVLKRGQFAYNKSYSKGYPYGAIKRLERYDEGALSSLYICFELKNIDSNFMCKYFESNKWNYEVKLISGEGARNHGLLNLSPSDFFNIKLYVPTNKIEQLKIAKFIELLQEKIDSSKAKLEALKKYKKGISNRLLKKINFSEVTPLSKLCCITTGKLDANAMTLNGKYKFFTCSREEYSIDNYAFDCEALLISGNGEVGLTKYFKGKFNAYQRTYVLYDFKRNAQFIKMCIDNQISTVIRKETNKGAMPYIKLTTFNKILIPLISELEEKNIEKVINMIDKKIELQGNSLKALQLIKKQLLNSMFI
ncbi:restriction endonuclease subunit S [Pseudobutyrivibrio sp.]|uniref:restriction endonuclease subunit S n=1 Tax=Pseudobutyrivibrio sp. TaxID=2014367 RepID=UPI001B51F7DB|nr:restriction endonuclease subunit S [Pseudobutyrivibrio sp.]MBP3200926.1 restriction endonuclease subunit S [Lachnospiraceae bacterium]MBP3261972.1 restriction endonuclease subunit S [Pseudobutyrivibrio sp.]